MPYATCCLSTTNEGQLFRVEWERQKSQDFLLFELHFTSKISVAVRSTPSCVHFGQLPLITSAPSSVLATINTLQSDTVGFPGILDQPTTALAR
jgi:hypothetical protein